MCLFGKDEVSLRDTLRDPSLSHDKENELVNVISAAVKRKKFSHGGQLLCIKLFCQFSHKQYDVFQN